MEGEELDEPITIETDSNEDELHAYEPQELINIESDPSEEPSEEEEQANYPNELIHVESDSSEDFEAEYLGISIYVEDPSEKPKEEEDPSEPKEEEEPLVENLIEHNSKVELPDDVKPSKQISESIKSKERVDLRTTQ